MVEKHYAAVGTVVRSGVLLALAVFALVASFPPSAVAGETEVTIAGAGPSTKVVEQFVTYLATYEAAKGLTFVVPEKSIKHAGGIRSSEKNIFGRTGRPLNDKEKAEGVEEIFLAKMPIVFVAGAKTGIESLTLDQVCGVFGGRYVNWSEVGGNDEKIVVISREPTEALFMELKGDVPCLAEAVDTKYILKKDDHVIDMIKTTDAGQAAIGFGAARNFPEQLHVAVEGFSSGVRLGLVYREDNRELPLVMAARKAAASAEWSAELDTMGLGKP